MFIDSTPTVPDIRALIVDSGPVVLQATTNPYAQDGEVHDDGSDCDRSGE